MIRALCVMKDEGDIIEQSLREALVWADEIIVLDNGSTDGSWAMVARIARGDSRIVPLGQDLRPFTDGMRARCFKSAAARARRGDWWCRLDADEIYAEDPREALAAADPESFSVWSAGLTYYFTDEDLIRYERSPELFADGQPVERKCRYYLNDSSEPRFFRHHPAMIWSEADSGFPPMVWLRPAARRRIVVRNYRYRSPRQMQRRLDARTAVEGADFHHERVGDFRGVVAALGHGEAGTVPIATTTRASWQDRVVATEGLNLDTGDGHYVLRPDLMPPLPEPMSMRRVLYRSLNARARTAMRPLVRRVAQRQPR